jgi:hypothetical protein
MSSSIRSALLLPCAGVSCIICTAQQSAAITTCSYILFGLLQQYFTHCTHNDIDSKAKADTGCRCLQRQICVGAWLSYNVVRRGCNQP